MRPFGVTLVGIYQLLRAFMGLAFGLFILFFVGPANKFASMSRTGNFVERHVGHMGHAAGVAIIVFAFVHILAGYGLWVMRNWARLLTILFSAIELALIVSRGLGGNVFSLPVGVLNAACIFFLAMPPVRRAFHGERKKAHITG
jgi:hypothetical protein